MVETQAPDDLLIRFWRVLARPSGGGGDGGSTVRVGDCHGSKAIRRMISISSFAQQVI